MRMGGVYSPAILYPQSRAAVILPSAEIIVVVPAALNTIRLAFLTHIISQFLYDVLAACAYQCRR